MCMDEAGDILSLQNGIHLTRCQVDYVREHHGDHAVHTLESKEELDRFNEDRRARIERQRKDAQSRESDLREDYDAVFKHGTTWQQVAKLVNQRTERLRDLLIVLKNTDDDQKAEQ